MHKTLSADATVTESDMLRDSRTGELREVDITIRTAVSGYPITVGIECVDHGRSATVQWVESMLGKHADLPTDKLILVASAGFSKQAITKAEARSAICLSLAQAEEAEWTTIVGKLPIAYLDVVAHAFTLSAMVVDAAGAHVLIALPFPTVLCNGERSQRVHAGDLASALVGRQDIGGEILRHMHDASLTEHDFQLVYRAGEIMFAVDADDALRRLVELRVALHSTRSQTAVPLQHRTAGTSHLAYGDAPGGAGELRIAVVETKGSPPVVEVTQQRGSGWGPLVNVDRHTER